MMGSTLVNEMTESGDHHSIYNFTQPTITKIYKLLISKRLY